jgi:hypothetical protein
MTKEAKADYEAKWGKSTPKTSKSIDKSAKPSGKLDDETVARLIKAGFTPTKLREMGLL